MLSNLKNKTLLGGRWETTGIVGEGACAQVYTVKSTQTPVPYELVAKVVPFTGGSSKANKQQDRICNTLNYEYVMYNGLLRGFPFCPRLPDKFYGDDQNLKVRYLVMERMDRDLVSVANSGYVPSSSYIAQLGLQILEGLKWIHQKNFLFIDVKPANFMLKGDKLYFVDCETFSFIVIPYAYVLIVYPCMKIIFSWAGGEIAGDACREDCSQPPVRRNANLLQRGSRQRRTTRSLR